MRNDLVLLAQHAQPIAEEMRRHLHRFPETRYDTARTRSYILERLREFGVTDVREQKGGIVFDLNFDGATDRRLFRADFDALPILEATGLPYASEHQGISHACGHDIHTAMLLAFVKCLSSNSLRPSHNLRIVLQDAEENPGSEPEALSGGNILVRDGVLEGVSSAHMIHVAALEKNGVFFSRPGALYGNSGRIRMIVKATGGHAGAPHTGCNALRITHAIQSRLDSFGAQHLPPSEALAMEPVILKAGTATNVMPSEAELWYGCRTLLPQAAHLALMEKVKSEVRAVVAGFPGASVEFQMITGHPATINDSFDVDQVGAMLKANDLDVQTIAPDLGGEDFAYYLKGGVPGSAWLLGAYQEGCGDHHTPTFNPDDSVMWRGILFWLLLAAT